MNIFITARPRSCPCQCSVCQSPKNSGPHGPGSIVNNIVRFYFENNLLIKYR